MPPPLQSPSIVMVALPKGPFRTKNSTGPESVVFCYRRSFLLSVPFSCFSFGSKQKGPAEQVAPRVSSLKLCRFWVCVFPILPCRKERLPKTPFRRGLSGTDSGGRFAPGRFCSLPILPRKTSISEHSPYRFAIAVANLLPVLNLLSVLFLVREGPLGKGPVIRKLLLSDSNGGSFFTYSWSLFAYSWASFLVAPSTGWMLYYLCFSPSTAIGPPLR